MNKADQATRGRRRDAYTAAIPFRVMQALPGLITDLAAADESRPYEIRLTAFPELDTDAQMFAIEVWYDAEVVRPRDKRIRPYTEATETTWYFDSSGNYLPEETTTRTGKWGR